MPQTYSDLPQGATIVHDPMQAQAAANTTSYSDLPPGASVVHDPGLPSISQHPNTASQYLQDVENDLRYGTGSTFIGRGAQKIMPRGMTAGKPEGIADFLGGPVVGPLEMAQGVATGSEGHPIKGAAQVVRGAGKTLAMPMAVVAPEATAMSLPRVALGAGVQAGSQALGVSEDTSTLLGAAAGMFGPDLTRATLKGTANLGDYLLKKTENVDLNKLGTFFPKTALRLAFIRNWTGRASDVAGALNDPTAAISDIFSKPQAGGAKAAPAPAATNFPSQSWSTATYSQAARTIAGPKASSADVTATASHLKLQDENLAEILENSIAQAQAAKPQAQPLPAGAYGKYSGKSNLSGNVRQIASPTGSTAPNPGVVASPHPSDIMRILTTPGDISDADMLKLQNYYKGGK